MMEGLMALDLTNRCLEIAKRMEKYAVTYAFCTSLCITCYLITLLTLALFVSSYTTLTLFSHITMSHSLPPLIK